MNYPGLAALRADWRLLAFGFLMAFASSAGQTYFISLFSQQFRDDFGMSHAGFGAIYSIATLASGFLLIWAGGLIDRVDLRLFAAVVLFGIGLASMVAASAVGPLTLGIGIFLLRFFGQGLASHTAVTATARYAEPAVRGKAVSLATLGFPAGEALWPIVAVAAIAAFGWRQSYGGAAVIAAVLILPVALLLLASHGRRHAAFLARTSSTGDADAERQWTRGEVARDPMFRHVLIAVMAPSFIVTGILFHQVHLAEVKGWDLGAFAAGYVGYAICQVSTALIAGPVIDRVGARRTARFYLAPLGLGLLVLATFDPIWSGYLFLMSAGATAGVSATLLGTLWAELYGVRHLGAIRALVTACSVVASALSPALLGLLLDLGIPMEALALACAAYIVVSIVILLRLFSGGGETGSAPVS
ncbi:major facilitator superfamily MFS_1 [alpha proteobacterium BAL199]|jgi:MFS family permease|nr:major facilitator superfamily MFS_1 [alpha proteobacterium BAL199]